MPHTRSAARSRLIVAAVAVVVVLADSLTKIWATSALANRSVDLVGSWLRFDLTRNGGAAFGTFRGGTVLLTIVATGAVVWVLFYAGRVTRGWTLAGLGLIAGGASGNLVDRFARSPGLLRGHVVDFIRLPHWPTFNLADIAVVAGVALVVLTIPRHEHGTAAPSE